MRQERIRWLPVLHVAMLGIRHARHFECRGVDVETEVPLRLECGRQPPISASELEHHALADRAQHFEKTDLRKSLPFRGDVEEIGIAPPVFGG